MIDLYGYAWLGFSGISVRLFGALGDTCTKATITDKYPGGKINYVIDPRRAEVFITENRQSDIVCLPSTVPWKGQVDVFSTNPAHDTVRVYVNGQQAIEDIEVITFGDDRNITEKQLDILPWKVIALVGINPDDNPPFFGCEIVPDHMAIPAVYKKVYSLDSDPASYSACEAFVEKNCKALS